MGLHSNMFSKTMPWNYDSNNKIHQTRLLQKCKKAQDGGRVRGVGMLWSGSWRLCYQNKIDIRIHQLLKSQPPSYEVSLVLELALLNHNEVQLQSSYYVTTMLLL